MIVIQKDIRYLDGKIKCNLIEIMGNKALIMYLEEGDVGNRKVGYKTVKICEIDIILGVRRLWKKKRC
ncbi:MAG: hypothetical protein ACFFHV_20305 [Promethearchaeota archaeon]